jgi:hypothetical protein
LYYIKINTTIFICVENNTALVAYKTKHIFTNIIIFALNVIGL